jgi:hypothetical protein
MQTTNQIATHAYYRIAHDSTGFPVGSVQALFADMGDQWVMFGIADHCDSSGDLIEPGQQLLFAIGQEHNGETVQVLGKAEMHRVTSLPNGEIDINSEQSKVDDKKYPRVIYQSEYRSA